MFSVIIPLYNKESSIVDTVQSVLRQSYPNFEIIIVNDGSTDNSLNLVLEINDPRIRVIDKKNGGVSSARNEGIRQANYDWICFLDADDFWDVDKLEICLVEINRFSEAKWLITGYHTIKNRVKFDFVYNIETQRLENIFDDLNKGLKIQTSAVLVKKDTFDTYDNLYFTVGMNNSEDREVWYKLACIDKRPIYIARSLSEYIIDTNDSNSLTATNAKLTKRNFLNMKARLIDFIKLLEADDRQKLEYYIDNFNKKAVLNSWINGTADDLLLAEVPNSKLIFRIFNSSPKIIKKIIVRLCF